MADREDFADRIAYWIKTHLPNAMQNTLGRLGIDSAGGVQHSVEGTRVWWVDETGELREGKVPRIENTLGRLSLDSAGGVQHSVGGTRVWWVNDQGRLVQGIVPLSALESMPGNIENTLGRLGLDSAGGLQHSVSGTRVWWSDETGTLREGTVPWDRITNLPDPAPTPGALKVTPLALTTGWGGADAQTARAVRVPIKFNAPIGRWRLHMRNWNPRVGLARGAVSVTGLWLGIHNGTGGFTGAPTHINPAFSTPSNGDEWVSQWFEAPIGGNVERLIAYGYTAAAAPHAMAGGSYQYAEPERAGDPAFTTAVSFTSTPLDLWIEAETPTSIPVVAGFGDSLTSGIGATLPVHESWLSRYARTIGGLPYHASHGGESINGILTGMAGKIERWEHLARADTVVWSMGSNDLGGNRTLAQMQADFSTVRPMVEASIGPVDYVSTVQPRDAWDAAKEAERTAWNDWVKGQGFRGVLDFAAVASTDGETILPEYNADGTHLNTVGYAAEAASVRTPLATTRAHSGVQNVTTLLGLATGKALLEVSDGTVWLTFEGATLTGTGNVDLTTTGLLPVAPEAPRLQHDVLVFEATTPRRMQVNSFGYARIFAYAGGALSGTVSWPMTRPAPTIWPGNPA